MRRRACLCFLSVLFSANMACAQLFRLNGKVELDTLWVRMDLNEDLEPGIRQAYVDHTRARILKFNSTKRGFVLMETEGPHDRCLTITIDSVHIATPNAQHGAFAATLVGVVVVPTVMIVGGSPFFVAFWVNGVSRVYGGFDVSGDLRSKYYKRPRIRLHANAGWFKGEERKRKLVAAVYDYRLNKVIKQLHRRLR